MELICLANSYKHAGRCIAGLRTHGGGWIRPVSARGDGTLFRPDYLLDDGSEPQLLDVIKIPAAKKAPMPHQPENWLIDGKKWKLVSRGPSPAWRLLEQAVVRRKELFGDNNLSVPYARFDATPAKESLALVQPEGLSLTVATGFDGKTRVRASLSLLGAPYDLPVTDPGVLAAARQRGLGTFPASSVWVGQDKFMATVSLTEPLDGTCYKLIAAIFPTPA